MAQTKTTETLVQTFTRMGRTPEPMRDEMRSALLTAGFERRYGPYCPVMHPGIELWDRVSDGRTAQIEPVGKYGVPCYMLDQVWDETLGIAGLRAQLAVIPLGERDAPKTAEIGARA